MLPVHLSSFKMPNANIKCAISTIQMHTKYLFGFKLIWRLSFVFCDVFFYHVFQLFQETKITVYVLFITVHALFMGHTTTLFRKKILKMDPIVLFTHLKIILLQYFQFLVFNFSKNKLYPNGPYVLLFHLFQVQDTEYTLKYIPSLLINLLYFLSPLPLLLCHCLVQPCTYIDDSSHVSIPLFMEQGSKK